MAHTVNANGLTISHKGTGGYETNSTPDLCKMPNNVPVPFNIVSFSKDLIRGTTSVFADGGNTIDCKGSAHSKCIGDEPGVRKGVISGTQLDESTWITWSPNVRVEGRNVARLSDKMFMNNKNCISGAGGHYEVPASIKDPILRELCKIFCETRDEWHKCKKAGGKCTTPSNAAQGKVNDALKNKKTGLGKSLGKKIGAAERAFFSSADKMFDGARKVYDKAGMERAIKRKVEKYVGKELLEKGAKIAGRSWLKVVPGLNVLSTIYDVVDLAMTGAEIYNMVKGADMILDKAIKIKPDFAVMDENGALEKIYDFKFDDPDTGYLDDWQKKAMQKEAYETALPEGQSPQKVDNETCKCDKGPKKGSVGI